jgi:nicotinate-nucleotide--dimethylbenzimidazole phosphoribosyltransferase
VSDVRAPGAELIATMTATMPDPDPAMRQAGLDRWDALAKPPGALGRLEKLGAWVCAAQGACPPEPLRDVRVVVFAGDHGIAASGVSAYPAAVTASMVRTMVAGGAAVNALARQVGAQVSVYDMAVDADLSDLGPSVVRHKVRRGTGSIDREDAMSLDESIAAFAAGRAVADEAADSGAQLLVVGDMGIGNTTPSAALVALLTRNEVIDVVGRGTGIDDVTWMRKTAAIRDGVYRGRTRLSDPLDLLAALGGPDIAAMAGCLTQAAMRRTPVVLDGLVSTTAALIAQRVSFKAPRWFVAGHRSTEPAHSKALERLGLHPLIEASMRLGEATGALTAVPMVQAAAALLGEMALLDDVVPADLPAGQAPDDDVSATSEGDQPAPASS